MQGVKRRRLVMYQLRLHGLGLARGPARFLLLGGSQRE